jgi:uncharacterized protein (DUF362 family)
MIDFNREMLTNASVALSSLPSPAYPESQVENALHNVAQRLGWLEEGRGPFGKVIPPGARILVKPNLVLHANEGPWGIDPLVTHLSLIRAVVEAALLAQPAEILVGDAPLQGCDFHHLLSLTGLGEWADRKKRVEPAFKGVRDFRRTTCVFLNGVRMASEGLQSEERFVLFDLGNESLLEPISNGHDPFRVTCYDPRLLARTHGPGHHQYLIAKEVIEADVIINLPKLKTHKKAGITCALKNLIGINGNKEFLPHHRLGGSHSGGDCYPNFNPIKRTLEYISDRENTSSSFTAAKAWHGLGKQFQRILWMTGDKLGTEGSWSGNDTIWRTCLDLNRILIYGRTDGSMRENPQRQVLHIVDAVIAGQGDGPLSPQPLPLGMIMAGNNAAAVDWVGAYLLGYDPQLIPLIRQALGNFKWPITSFDADDITLFSDQKSGSPERVIREWKRSTPVIHPIGWRDAAIGNSKKFVG